MGAFVLMLREGVEAALIVGILLAYLRSIGHTTQARWVWFGTAAAVVVSLVAGIWLHSTIGSLTGREEEIVEGVVALTAAGLLTWMVIWLAGGAREMRRHLQAGVDGAMAGGGVLGLAAVAFVAVLREGLETALFLVSATVGADAGLDLLGALAGLAAATGIGYLVYQGGRRVDIRLFFRITGVLIVLFAAGLVAKGVHELQEAQLVPVLLDPVWDLRGAGLEVSAAGRIAEDVLGWTPAPTLLQAAAYFAYLVPVGWGFLHRTRPVQTAAQTLPV